MQRNELTFPKDSFLGRIDQESWDRLSSLWTVSTYRAGHHLISADDEGLDVFFVMAQFTNRMHGSAIAVARQARGEAFSS